MTQKKADIGLVEKVSSLGDLKEIGWESVSVKEEMRKNLIARMKSDQVTFDGILGYEETVIPQIQQAILAKHDFILLGLRGQGKTRLLRQMIYLLDEYMPIVKGSVINDDPFRPLSRFACETLQDMGDDTPISWVSREERFSEKLATPDTTVSDLTREDDSFNWTVAFNWRKPGPPNKKIPMVALTFSETETDSNILNFDTNTRDANLALTWVF